MITIDIVTYTKWSCGFGVTWSYWFECCAKWYCHSFVYNLLELYNNLIIALKIFANEHLNIKSLLQGTCTNKNIKL